MRKVFVLLLLGLVAGCAKDDRAKQASNLLNVMTQTAASEYETAPTPPDKDAVATEYFKQAPQFTQGLDDYMHDRPPTTLDVPIPAPAPQMQSGTSKKPNCVTGG